MSIEKKNKIKKICFITSICLNFIFIFVLIFSAFNKRSVKNDVKVDGDDVVLVNNEEKRGLISYDDENGVINIDASELNSYVFPNLSHTFADFYNNDGNWDFFDSEIVLLYDDEPYDFMSASLDDLDTDSYVEWGVPGSFIYFSDSVDFDNIWYLQTTDYESFEHTISLEFDLSSSYYAVVKQALINDVNYNNDSFRLGIFEGLGSGIVAFVGTLSSGLNSVTSLFWYNNALTTFGLLSVIVVSVAIAYFLLRFFIGLVRLRGN